MSQHPAVKTRKCLLLLALLIPPSGCAGLGTSRWAMDDPVYSEKYSKPYKSNDGDKVVRMMKQSIDARHVGGRGGTYIGAAGSDDPVTAGAEIGVFNYINPSLEARAGLKGLAGTEAKDWFLGGDFGLRVQAPTRLAPFAGVGTYLGGNRRSELAINDHIDNDNDNSVDERGERKSVYSYMASVYPELGVHYWLNGSTRLSSSAQYHLTTEGRDADFWFIGLSLSFLSDPPAKAEPRPERVLE